MFLESESPSKGAEVVAQETGVRLVSGLWVETLRSADESYSDFLRSNVNIIVENHGGFSSNAMLLAKVMKKTNLDNCGTLPDFGNFW